MDRQRLVVTLFFIHGLILFGSRRAQSEEVHLDVPTNSCSLILREVVANQGRNSSYAAGFTRDRDLLDYLRTFPQELADKLATLGADTTILEAGAGNVVAGEQLMMTDLEKLFDFEQAELNITRTRIKSNQNFASALKKISEKPLLTRPSLIAVTQQLERKINVAAYHGKLSVIQGSFFEDIPNDKLGHPSVILDRAGVMSYTSNPTLVLNKYLAILKDQGEIFLSIDKAVRLLNIRTEIHPQTLRNQYTISDQGVADWKYMNIPRWTVELENNKVIHFLDWLLSLNEKGLSVEVLENKAIYYRLEDPAPIAREDKYITVKIKKKNERYQIPQLELIAVDASENPPSRKFKIIPSRS